MTDLKIIGSNLKHNDRFAANAQICHSLLFAYKVAVSISISIYFVQKNTIIHAIEMTHEQDNYNSI